MYPTKVLRGSLLKPNVRSVKGRARTAEKQKSAPTPMAIPAAPAATQNIMNKEKLSDALLDIQCGCNELCDHLIYTGYYQDCAKIAMWAMDAKNQARELEARNELD